MLEKCDTRTLAAGNHIVYVEGFQAPLPPLPPRPCPPAPTRSRAPVSPAPKRRSLAAALLNC